MTCPICCEKIKWPEKGVKFLDRQKAIFFPIVDRLYTFDSPLHSSCRKRLENLISEEKTEVHIKRKAEESGISDEEPINKEATERISSREEVETLRIMSVLKSTLKALPPQCNFRRSIITALTQNSSDASMCAQILGIDYKTVKKSKKLPVTSIRLESEENTTHRISDFWRDNSCRRNYRFYRLQHVRGYAPISGKFEIFEAHKHYSTLFGEFISKNSDLKDHVNYSRFLHGKPWNVRPPTTDYCCCPTCIFVEKEEKELKLLEDQGYDLSERKAKLEKEKEWHTRNVTTQRNAFREQVNNLVEGHLIIVMDYIGSPKAPKFKKQTQKDERQKIHITFLTLHTIMRRPDESLCRMNFDFISDDRHEDHIFLEHCFSIFLSDLYQSYLPSKPTSISLWSDNPSSEFKNRFSMKFLFELPFFCPTLCSNPTWHFYGTHHGKSVCDAHGGIASRACISAVEDGKDIRSSEDVIDILSTLKNTVCYSIPIQVPRMTYERNDITPLHGITRCWKFESVIDKPGTLLGFLLSSDTSHQISWNPKCILDRVELREKEQYYIETNDCQYFCTLESSGWGPSLTFSDASQTHFELFKNSIVSIKKQ